MDYRRRTVEVKKRSGGSWAPILFGLNASKDGMIAPLNNRPLVVGADHNPAHQNRRRRGERDA
ncbi:MAG: hypothetical protein AMXMBFR22_27050 [Phycisphaerae bacterium]